MDATLNIVERFSLQRVIPMLLALSFFTLPLSSTAKSICLSLAMIAIVLTTSYRKDISSFLKTRWCKAGLIFFTIALVACLWSPASYSQKLLEIEKYSKLLYLPVLVLGFRDARTRSLSLHAFLAAMFLTSSLASLKFNGFLSWLNINPDSLFRNHIIVGYMLDFAAYTTALFAYRESGLRRLVYSLLFILFSYHVLFVNGGRMGYIVYLLSMLLLIVQLFSWRKAVIAIVLVCSAMLLIFSQSAFMNERMQALKTNYEHYQQHDGDNPIGFRLQFHNYAFKLFKHHPFIGNGTSSFAYYFKKDNPVPGWGHGLLEPHNQYWLVASEYGLLGLVALLGLFFSLFKASLQLNLMRPLALAMLLSFYLGSLSDSLLFYSGSGYFFILVMALCFGEKAQNEPQPYIPGALSCSSSVESS